MVDNPSLDAPIMQEEIFGPILPVLPFDRLEGAVQIVQNHPNPLAAYFFSRNKQALREMKKAFSYGSCCINDTVLHLSLIHI